MKKTTKKAPILVEIWRKVNQSEMRRHRESSHPAWDTPSMTCHCTEKYMAEHEITHKNCNKCSDKH